MALSMLKSLRKSTASISLSSSFLNQISSTSSTPSFLKPCGCGCAQLQNKLCYSNAANDDRRKSKEEEYGEIPTEGISRPMSEILKQLNKKVPDSLISVRPENGASIKYIPWHIVNRIMNLHAPEWSGEVRNITYSPDAKSVTVVYRVTLHGTDAEIYRESTGTASVEEKGYGDAVQKAEGMAFRRACARLGLGLHLYHEDMS
ncbi:DNA repair RAD52-like protein 1, mitochondrial [Chenopodium quinoa]|nr:DNA repair RAD52-like protein 1, mitochondrial [Chenopodium quinoa]XP_021775310.1 DNA repair RAD52-like protein 1, mitochondrial [Chenopodium quinoa]